MRAQATQVHCPYRTVPCPVQVLCLSSVTLQSVLVEWQLPAVTMCERVEQQQPAAVTSVSIVRKQCQPIWHVYRGTYRNSPPCAGCGHLQTHLGHRAALWEFHFPPAASVCGVEGPHLIGGASLWGRTCSRSRRPQVCTHTLEPES